MIASGTTVRTSINPAARAVVGTGGTPGTRDTTLLGTALRGTALLGTALLDTALLDTALLSPGLLGAAWCVGEVPADDAPTWPAAEDGGESELPRLQPATAAMRTNTTIRTQAISSFFRLIGHPQSGASGGE
jgi:hypothetical protein